MGTGYTRNDTANNIADGNVINASDLDGEFDAVQAAFNGTTGHSHDGTTGEGPKIATSGLADNAVTTAKITNANVTTAKIADANVTTAKIADANVTLAKMAANSVDSDQYVDGSIDTAHIANDAVTGDKLANNIQIAGLGVTGETTLTTHLNMGDNDIIKLGASADLQIYHDGSNSYIDDAGSGNLRIRGNDGVYIQKYTGEPMVYALADGGVYLYYDNAEKLATTSTGVSVTGNITVSGTVDGRDVASDGSKLDGIEANAKNDQTITAGNGLTGGGTGDVTLNVGAGTGISVAADTVGLATAGAGAGTYGSTSDGTKIDQITLDAYGRVTAITTGATGSSSTTGTVTSVATGGGLTGGTITGSGTISHADTSSQASVNNSGTTFIQDVTLDTYGHVTGLTSATVSAGGAAPTVAVFNSSGTWNKPANCKGIKVTVVGGGGGGGAAGSNSSADPGAAGGGGGGGGGSVKFIDVAAVNSVSVTVGNGGAGSTDPQINAVASSGNTSSFGAYASATGGGGGASGFCGKRLGTGGSGGTGSSGDFNALGGGGQGGMIGRGAFFDTNSFSFAGAGGSSILSPGQKLAHTNSANSRSAGPSGVLGAGGGGAQVVYTSNPGSPSNGGAGGSGCVVVEQFF